MLNQFQYYEGDVCVVTICLDLTVYLGCPFPDAREGIVQFYNLYADEFGKEMKWYATESMGKMSPITSRALTMLPSWFAPDAKKRGEYGMFMHSGKVREGVSDKAFDMFGDADQSYTNFLRMVMPVSYIENDPGRFINLLKSSVGKLPFLSGHAGYAFVLDTRGRYEGKAMQMIKGWAPRHPGIDIGKPLSTSWYTVDAIKSINWLTLLNDSFCEKLGGKGKIEKQLKGGIHTIPNGIIIQAGASPQIGDLNRGDNLPVYRKVARVVKPIRLTEHRPLGLMDEDQTMAWFDRFDD